MENFFALIIGTGGKDIPETVTDATAVYNVLTKRTQGAYEEHNTFLLTNNDSTKDKIIEAFDKIITRSTDNATVFIYFSGHGQRFFNPASNTYDYYLITNGADERDKETTMLNGLIFSEKISLIKARRLLVMIDCCYAGGMGKLKTKSITTQPLSNRALFEKLEGGKGRVFISSCDDDETSVILPDAENSLFTAVTLEVLKGLFSQKSREFVSALDLISTVLEQVPERLEKWKHNQTPILTGAEGVDFKYFVCRNGGWEPPVPPIEESLEKLNINLLDKKSDDDIYRNDDKGNYPEYFDDLDDDDKDSVNEFFRQLDLDDDIQADFKVSFINDVGGLRNLKKVNREIAKIEFNKSYSIDYLNTENILNDINLHIDEQQKLDIIKNYKNKM